MVAGRALGKLLHVLGPWHGPRQREERLGRPGRGVHALCPHGDSGRNPAAPERCLPGEEGPLRRAEAPAGLARRKTPFVQTSSPSFSLS